MTAVKPEPLLDKHGQQMMGMFGPRTSEGTEGYDARGYPVKIKEQNGVALLVCRRGSFRWDGISDGGRFGPIIEADDAAALQKAATECDAEDRCSWTTSRDGLFGMTLLQTCVRYSAGRCVEALLQAGADPNQWGFLPHGVGTALHLAAIGGETRIAALLLRAGADQAAQMSVVIRDHNGFSRKGPNYTAAQCAAHAAELSAMLGCRGVGVRDVESAHVKSAWDAAVASCPPAPAARVGGASRVLYHQTSRAARDDIVASNRMMRGRTGLAGGGIYFAESPEETEHKAHYRGWIIQARVRLGRAKVFDGAAAQRSFTFSELRRDGYDSVEIVGRRGREFVVYNWDQVEVINSWEA